MMVFVDLPGSAQTNWHEPADMVNNRPDPSAANFVAEMARENDFEAALAQIGVRKARNKRLREFCTQLQKEKLLAKHQLGPLALKYNVSLQQPLTHEQQKQIALIQQLEGTAFDCEFAEQILKTDQHSIARFEAAAGQARWTDVNEYAQTILSSARQHLHQATEVAHSVGMHREVIEDIIGSNRRAVGGTGEQQESLRGSGSKTNQGSHRNIP